MSFTDKEIVACLMQEHAEMCFENGWHVDEDTTPYSAGADAINTLNTRATPKVKPLVWTEKEIHDEGGKHFHMFAGPYEIAFSGNMKRVGLHYHYIESGNQGSVRYGGQENSIGAVDELKKDAEAINIIRILSALETRK